MSEGAGRAVRALAAYLTGSEAKMMADRLADGDPLGVALRALSAARRDEARPLLEDAGLGTADLERTVSVLRAVEGARSDPTYAVPVWTLPGNLARAGHLTSQMSSLVLGAREAVTCATYNFAPSSALWTTLSEVSQRPEMSVRLYLDTTAADVRGGWRGPMTTTGDVAQALPKVTVLRTRRRDGRLVRSHTKFITIDHRTLIVTSANFSASAEEHNVEMGLVIEDRSLAESIERQMRLVEDDLYERVRAHQTS